MKGTKRGVRPVAFTELHSTKVDHKRLSRLRKKRTKLGVQLIQHPIDPRLRGPSPICLEAYCTNPMTGQAHIPPYMRGHLRMYIRNMARHATPDVNFRLCQSDTCPYMNSEPSAVLPLHGRWLW